MKLCISNIAWDPAADDVIAGRMRAAGASAVEVAPTKYWKDLARVDSLQAQALRQTWASRGFPIVATQSLLFGRPELTLFGADEALEATLVYLEKVITIGAQLGATAQVFGSPRNRLVGAGAPRRAWDRAVTSFRRLGEHAAREGTCLCIEPNPPAYACDFVTRAEEGARLVDDVGSPGFGLHLDAAGMLLAGDDGVACARRFGARLKHFHLSAPNLGPVRPDAGLPYAELITALRESDYGGWFSIEMRQQESDGVEGALKALEHVASLLS